MNQIYTAKLYHDFPHLYRGRTQPRTESAMSYGFLCGDGWFRIIHDLSTNIADHLNKHPELDLEVFQVKRKFGVLNFQLVCSNSPYTHGDQTIHELIANAQIESAQICEVCGIPGCSQEENGLQGVLCSNCAKDRQSYAILF